MIIEPLSVVHIGSGRYKPYRRDHVTYGIWRELASGFRRYHVIGRSAGGNADWCDGNLRVDLIRSWVRRDVEFLITQFAAISRAVATGPNVVVCQSPPLGGLAGLMIASRTGAKILIEIHGAEFFAPARFGSRLWLLQLLTKFALQQADKIRVLSPGMRQRLIEHYGSALDGRVAVLPPRVDLSRFARRPVPQVGSDALRIAMVGAVNPNKGQLRLIRCLMDAPLPMTLLIVGDGPDLVECRARSAEFSLRGSNLQVECYGAIPHTQVAEVLHSSDVFVMYSATEATPRAILEAMASGLPVVTTNAGFCADVVEHGAEGFVLGPDPDSQVLFTLERFRADPALAERMGAAARRRAERDYDSERLFDEYRRLIAETAGS